MKPQKQIDFLVEEFFNTGKLDLNKDEEGITFDQLIVESKYGHLVGKEFVHHNPNNNRVATFTITKIDDKNDEDAYVTVLDSAQTPTNFNLRFLVRNSSDLQQALKIRQLNNFFSDEEIENLPKPAVPTPPDNSVADENSDGDENGAEENIDEKIKNILHKADTLDELEDTILEELYKLKDDVTDPVIYKEMKDIYWTAFKEREKEIEKALSLDQEVRGYEPTQLSAGAQEVLRDTMWENMEMVELKEAIKILENELEDIKDEEEATKEALPHSDTSEDRQVSRQSALHAIAYKRNIVKEQLEELTSKLKELEYLNDPNYLFAEVFIENPCFINTLIIRRSEASADKERETNNFLELRKRILKKYKKSENTNNLDKNFKFFKTLRAGWKDRGAREDVIKIRIQQLIDNLNNPKKNPYQLFPDKEKCTIEQFDELREPDRFVYRAEQSVKKALPIEGNATVEEMTKMALYRVNAIFNIIQNDDNDILKMRHAIQDKYKKLLQLIKSYGLGEKIEEWKSKYADADKGEKRYMVRLVEDSLREVVYGLGQMESQMKDIIDNEHLADDKTLKVLNNVYKRVNDADTITDNLQAIRKNNSKIYELSFTNCLNRNDNTPYFIHSSHQDMDENGDGSTIVGNSTIIGSDNNVWLRERMDDIINKRTTVSDIINIIYGEISPDRVVKFDIKSAQDVMVTPISGGENFTIPQGSYIEVKKSLQHSYHLSEFFGVYKNYKKFKLAGLERYNTEPYKKVYNQIIKGVISKINTSKNDKGVIGRLKGEGGTFGVFFQNYIFYKLEDLDIKWTDKGQRITESRMTISVTPKEKAVQYQWTREDGNCNCKPLLSGVDCDDNLPHLNESLDDYISEALGF